MCHRNEFEKGNIPRRNSLESPGFSKFAMLFWSDFPEQIDHPPIDVCKTLRDKKTNKNHLE